ncbi:MAG: MerC domain-containing protein [Bacteroidetes bacterium]|nr:MAG: MerC domain-containing protein [Bacteroidota bacterium]
MMSKINWDAMGISASVACAVHCAVLPLLGSSLPIFGISIINNSSFEFFMILLAFAIGSLALIHGYRKHHRNLMPIFLFSAGMLLLFAKQIWHERQFLILPFAVIVIVAGHLHNFRLSRVAGAGTKKPKITSYKLFPISKT